MFLSHPLSPRLSAVARLICELGDWNVSNLRLQKLLYICHMIYLGRAGKPLIDENFEAWMFGPVCPQLYQKTRVFGAGPVGDRFYNAAPLPADIQDVITDVCSALKQKSDANLVALTHMDGGGWSKNYLPDRYGVAIPSGDILDEYRSRFSK